MAAKAQKIPFDEVAAPSTPATGEVVIYAKSDGLMYSKDDAGTETVMSGGGLTSDVAAVTTNETLTGNNSFVDLATPGPAVTITVNTKVQVTVGAEVSWTGAAAASRYAAMGFVLSSGNTLAADRRRSYIVVGAENSVNGGDGASRVFVLTGLTPGSTVFTAKYNQLGTGATANWQNREISVVCLD